MKLSAAATLAFAASASAFTAPAARSAIVSQKGETQICDSSFVLCGLMDGIDDDAMGKEAHP